MKEWKRKEGKNEKGNGKGKSSGHVHIYIYIYICIRFFDYYIMENTRKVEDQKKK
jgi:hypothetical protein